MPVVDQTSHHQGASGRVVLIAGPQGVGKTYLANKLRDAGRHFVIAPGVVTRAARGVQDGNDVPITTQEFKRRSDSGELCLETIVGGEHYAYLKAGIQDELVVGNNVLVLLLYASDVQQALIIWPDAVRIYLRPSEWDLICDRLTLDRGYSAQEAHLAIESARAVVEDLDRAVWDLRIDVTRDTDQVTTALAFLSRIA